MPQTSFKTAFSVAPQKGGVVLIGTLINQNMKLCLSKFT